jgi:pyruvate, water dikinase
MSHCFARFQEARLVDLPRDGGKNTSLSELYGELTPAAVRVPNGFAVTGEPYAALPQRA